MGNTENVNQESAKINDFIKALENVSEKFQNTKINEYQEKGNYENTFWIGENEKNMDRWSVMDRCISDLKGAVKELENVCDNFTKSLSQGGLFSVSNIYLKRISKNAKAFYDDLSKLKSATSKKICEENMKKFSKSQANLREALSAAADPKIKAFRNPAKIQDDDVKELMRLIEVRVRKFDIVYSDYSMYCFSYSSSQKTQKSSEKFASALEGVLKKFEMTNLIEYYKLKHNKYRETFVKNKGDSVDTYSVMDNCVYNLKLAVEALEDVCNNFTKSFSEGGLFSVSNTCLKKISKSAKAFYRDLGNLKSATSYKICEENKNKFLNDADELSDSLDHQRWPKVKTLRKSAKIQDENVQKSMLEMSKYIAQFTTVYTWYQNKCFSN